MNETVTYNTAVFLIAVYRASLTSCWFPSLPRIHSPGCPSTHPCRPPPAGEVVRSLVRAVVVTSTHRPQSTPAGKAQIPLGPVSPVTYSRTCWRRRQLPRNFLVTSWRLPLNICYKEVTGKLVPVHRRRSGWNSEGDAWWTLKVGLCWMGWGMVRGVPSLAD